MCRYPNTLMSDQATLQSFIYACISEKEEEAKLFQHPFLTRAPAFDLARDYYLAQVSLG